MGVGHVEIVHSNSYSGLITAIITTHMGIGTGVGTGVEHVEIVNTIFYIEIGVEIVNTIFYIEICGVRVYSLR